MAEIVPPVELEVPPLSEDQKALLAPEAKPTDEVIQSVVEARLAALDAQLQGQ